MTAEEILERGDYLAHFNPNHDPRNGQFAKGRSIVGSIKEKHRQNQIKMVNGEMRAATNRHEIQSRYDEKRRAKAEAKGDKRSVGYIDNDIKAANIRYEKEMKRLQAGLHKLEAKGDQNRELTPRQQQVRKRAAIAAGAMAGASLIATLGNYIGAEGAANVMGLTINPAYAATSGVVKAGGVAAASALAVVGGHMVSDYMRGRKQD